MSIVRTRSGKCWSGSNGSRNASRMLRSVSDLLQHVSLKKYVELEVCRSNFTLFVEVWMKRSPNCSRSRGSDGSAH